MGMASMRRALCLASVVLTLVAVPAARAQYSNDAVTGASGGGGGVTSIATACGVSGGPITTTGTIQGAAVIRAATGTTDTILSSDCGKLVTESNAAPVAVTLPQATGSFAAPFFYTQINSGAGTVTITPTTSTINGAATLVLTTGQSADIASDGTNYVAALGKGGASVSAANPTATASDVAVNGVAASFLRSDGAPAVQKGSNAQFGLAQGDNITASMTGGLVSTKGLDHPGYRANIYYALFPHITASSASGAPTAATAYCSVGRIGGASKVTISSLVFRVSTAGTSNAQLAIYNSDFASGINRPGTLIANTGNININGVTGSIAGTFTGVQINPAWYWYCLQVNDTAVRYNIVSGTAMPEAIYVGSATLTGFLTPGPATGVSTTTGIGAFGTWPSFVGATFNETTALGPQVAVLFSSVP